MNAVEARPGAESGFALIAVLVVLGVLLALATPFALSMGRGEAVAFQRVDETQVDWGSASVRNQLLGSAGRGHPAVDPSFFADGLDEYPASLEIPEAFGALQGGGRLLLAGEVWDLQRKIDIKHCFAAAARQPARPHVAVDRRGAARR